MPYDAARRSWWQSNELAGLSGGGSPAAYFGGSIVMVDFTSNFWNWEFAYSVRT